MQYRTAVKVPASEAPTLVRRLIEAGGPPAVVALLKPRISFDLLQTDVHDVPPFGLHDSKFSLREDGVHYILSWENVVNPSYMFLTLAYS